MTCAKVVVRACLRLPDGSKYFGENECCNPQERCPRLPGEGYDKCRTICDQPNHAEMNAILAAYNDYRDLQGGHMVVNYFYVCQNCQDVMKRFGITWECNCLT